MGCFLKHWVWSGGLQGFQLTSQHPCEPTYWYSHASFASMIWSGLHCLYELQISTNREKPPESPRLRLHIKNTFLAMADRREVALYLLDTVLLLMLTHEGPARSENVCLFNLALHDTAASLLHSYSHWGSWAPKVEPAQQLLGSSTEGAWGALWLSQGT